MKTTMKILALALLCTLTVHAQKAERTYKETYKTVGDPTVEIDSQFGSVHVSPSSGHTVTAVVRIKARNGSDSEAEELVNSARVEIKGSGKKVTIRTGLPNDMDEDEDRSIEIDVTVTVPVNTALKLESKFGSVDVKGVMGSVEADCGFGAMEIKDCANVTAENSFGEISLGNIAGTMNIEGQMGKIIAYGIPGGKIQNSYGEVEISNVAGKLEVKSSMGSVIIKGVRDADVTSSYGSVELYLSKSFSGRIEAISSFGSIDSDFPLKSKSKEKSFGQTGEKKYGTVGSGSDRITIKSSFGDISIEKE